MRARMTNRFQRLDAFMPGLSIVPGPYDKGAFCERLRSLDGTELLRKCGRFVKDHAEEIAAAEPEIPVDLNDQCSTKS
jgi:hypothetical protein